MTERAYQPPLEGEGSQPEIEKDFLLEMRSKLAVAVQSRQEKQSDFPAKQAEATRFTNEFWPSDKLLQIKFALQEPVFERDGLTQTEHELNTFLANRHAGFGARGALFVNDFTNESVYVADFFSNKLDFLKR